MGLDEDAKFLIYVAGYFDGEGCVRITDRGSGFGIHVFITNTYRPLLESLEATFGGRMTLRDMKTDKHRTQYQWRISNKTDALNFLEKIAPYIIEKGSQIELAIEFCKIPNMRGNKYKPGDPTIRERKGFIASELKRLKKIDYYRED